QAVGVWGESVSPNGIGMYGAAFATSGVPVGVYGDCYAPSGYGLYTPARLYVGGAAFAASLSASYVYHSSGAATAPPVTFTSSPGAGLFNPTNNVLGFATAGLERMRIAADGKIGIGVTNPTNAIQLAGGARSDGVTWINGSDRNLKENFAAVDSKQVLNK